MVPEKQIVFKSIQYCIFIEEDKIKITLVCIEIHLFIGMVIKKKINKLHDTLKNVNVGAN